MLPLLFKRATEAREIISVLKSLCEDGPERPLCEAIKVKPGLQGRSQDVEDNRDICQGVLHTESGASPRQTCL